MQSDYLFQWTLGTRCSHSHLSVTSRAHLQNVATVSPQALLLVQLLTDPVEVTLSLNRQHFPVLIPGLQAPVELTDEAQKEPINCFRVASTNLVVWKNLFFGEMKEYSPLAALLSKASESLDPYVGNSTWTGVGFANLVMIAQFSSSTPHSEVQYLSERKMTTIKRPHKCSTECFRGTSASPETQKDKDGTEAKNGARIAESSFTFPPSPPRSILSSNFHFLPSWILQEVLQT